MRSEAGRDRRIWLRRLAGGCWPGSHNPGALRQWAGRTATMRAAQEPGSPRVRITRVSTNSSSRPGPLGKFFLVISPSSTSAHSTHTHHTSSSSNTQYGWYLFGICKRRAKERERTEDGKGHTEGRRWRWQTAAVTYYCTTCSAVGTPLSPLSRRFQGKQLYSGGCIACMYARQPWTNGPAGGS